MSIFDPDTFLNSTTMEANETAMEPLPAGEYNAQVEEIKPREVTGKSGEPSYLIDVTYSVLDDAVKSTLGRDKITVRQSIWLDLTSQGQLETGKGKNIGLGKLRAAAGLNDPGQPFSVNHLKGSIVRISTGYRADRNDPSIQYAEVKSVGKPA